MKKILLTGGAGFIGSNLAHFLFKRHYQVVVLDALTYAANPQRLPNGIPLIVGDISDIDTLTQICQTQTFDAIINCAAESHVDRSIVDSTAFIKSNVLGVQVLLDACLQYNIAQFLQISTDEVYGSLGQSGKFTEDSPLHPSSPYSASKASADLLCQAWYRTHGLHINITRCSNNFGPNQHPEKFIPRMIQQAQHNLPLPIYGDGSNIRDWIHVDDHCAAILTVLEHAPAGEVYNVGSNMEWCNLDLAKEILRALNKPESLLSFIQDRKGHDWRYAVDSSKLQQQLGWSPKIHFEEALHQTIHHYLQPSKF